MREDEAEPRWLSGEEMQAWLALIGLVMVLPPALDSQLRRDAGLTRFEYQVMAELSHVPDRTLRMSQLAAHTDGSLSRLSHVVARLENKGWVRRTPDPADGRYMLAILTDEGWDKVVAAAPDHVAEVRRLIFDQLTAGQVRQLPDIARRIIKAIDATPQDHQNSAPPSRA